MTDDNYDACIDKIKKMFTSPRREWILDSIKNHANNHDAETHSKALRDLVEAFEMYDRVLNPEKE
jgi:hypothetical protein